MEEPKPHSLARLLHFTSKIAPHEVSACLLSFFLVFMLMSSYYIMRPVRDAMASDWTDAQLSFLWTLNFFISAAVVALYGWMVSRIRFRFLVPSVYGLFALSFVLFYMGITYSIHHHVWFDQSFYVWVSVFSLFNVSVFWSFMSDLFSKEQSQRLFPVIGAGASAGALFGPAIPTLLAGWVGIDHLLLVSVILLLLTMPLTLYLLRLQGTKREENKQEVYIGGNPFVGFRNFFTNRYLIGIGTFIVFYTSIASIVYFQQKNLLVDYSRVERTQILGGVDWLVNIFTFSVAFFATGRIVEQFGMAFTLSAIPFVMCAGLLTLAAAHVLLVALGLQVLRRGGNYAVTRPAREMLFTQVNREDRFKTKPVIDIVAYRGGDMATSWGFAALTQGLGLGLAPIAAIGAGIAAAWGMVGLFLGKRFEKIQ